MSITTSYHIGASSQVSVNLKHNLNIDDYRDKLKKERGYIINHEFTKNNVVLENNYDLKKKWKTNVLNILGVEIVGEITREIEKYNKGKKPSRQISIDKLFDENSKQCFVHKEGILQFGNEQERPTDATCVEMLQRTFESWKERHPYCYITSAVVHLDEKTPHLHFTFFTYKKEPERQRGLPFTLSFDKAVGDFNKDRKEVEQDMEMMATFRGLEIRNPGRGRIDHMNQKEFNKLQEQKRELEREKALLSLTKQRDFDLIKQLFSLCQRLGIDAIKEADNKFKNLFDFLNKKAPEIRKELEQNQERDRNIHFRL